jgi:CelD/BcsL family acetyltransferase involved in cellulose biosynthesis
LSDFKLRILESHDELRASATAWDDLWQRSPSALPPFRAEQILLWFEHFAPHAPIRAVVVANDSQWLAALPLIETFHSPFVSVAQLPNNFYSTGGELLFDAAAGDDVADVLVSGLAGLPWNLLWLNFVAYEQPAWKAVLAAAQRRNFGCFTQRSFDIGQVDLRCDYRTYEASRSRNHRRSVRRSTDRINDLGGAVLNLVTPTPEDDLEALLRRGFEVEDRSWKGQQGTSVLRTPRLFDFYLRQAHELAAHRQLKLAFLEHQGRAIAFEYAWSARGTYVSQKVGYDVSFAEASPSQLLRARLYERFCETGEEQLIDYRGILSEATARWATQSYTVGRVLLGSGTLAKSLIRMYRGCWPWYAKARTRLGRPAQPVFELRPLKRSSQTKKGGNAGQDVDESREPASTTC